MRRTFRLPPLLPTHLPNLRILLTPFKELRPMPQSLVNLNLRLPQFLLLQIFQLRLGVQSVNLRIIDGDVHLLDAAHVGRAIFGEAGGYEGARGVGTREEVVGTAWAVVFAPCGDIVDGAYESAISNRLLDSTQLAPHENLERDGNVPLIAKYNGLVGSLPSNCFRSSSVNPTGPLIQLFTTSGLVHFGLPIPQVKLSFVMK